VVHAFTQSFLIVVLLPGIRSAHLLQARNIYQHRRLASIIECRQEPAFFAAFVIAGFRAPLLPPIEITWDKRPTTGGLLAHIDGFWYVFNEDDRLLAIPDRKVVKAQGR